MGEVGLSGGRKVGEGKGSGWQYPAQLLISKWYFKRRAFMSQAFISAAPLLFAAALGYKLWSAGCHLCWKTEDKLRVKGARKGEPEPPLSLTLVVFVISFKWLHGARLLALISGWGFFLAPRPNWGSLLCLGMKWRKVQRDTNGTKGGLLSIPATLLGTPRRYWVRTWEISPRRS